ncbi:MAG: hypothetical protein ACREXM_07585 [Gammaproteobacteria bacterium]
MNTPDNRLEVTSVTPNGPSHRCSISVGLEPVAVAARTEQEVWVVNHLSDSVSIVQLDRLGFCGHVKRTLLVGDEPRDIVFAGRGRSRAFITTAHRGQNTGRDPQLTMPGVGRADVWVFEAASIDNSLAGTPLSVLSFFTDTPRALAVSPDGSRVYVAGFHSGNQTAAVNEVLVPDGFGLSGAIGPATNFEGIPAPESGVIAKFDGSHWVDTRGQVWDSQVPFNLPDRDVFAIDAMSDPPAAVGGSGGVYSGVGTILYNMVINPVTGKVYVSNTDAQNDLLFGGRGTFAGDALHGRLHLNRITILSKASVTARHLNKHIDYGECCAPLPNAESERSLALPMGMAISRDGKVLYVAAMGSSKIGVFDTKELENDTFVPDSKNHVEVSGGGPTGLLLDEGHGLLYVFTRFDNAVKTIDTATRSEIAQLKFYNPEPVHVVRGRPFLYDARTSSSHGDQACASCHVFGDLDSLAWNVGNPDQTVIENLSPYIGPSIHPLTGQPVDPSHHPLKGPMATQSLRGMANHGPMHWRGDATGGNDAETSQPDGGDFDERAAFAKFQSTFTDVLQRSEPISARDMSWLTDFVLELTFPPNPIRALDNSLTPEQAAGRDIFFNRPLVDAIAQCNGCHTTDPDGNRGATDKPGFFGTQGLYSFDLIPQVLKVPQLRNMYQKVGRFGMARSPVVAPGDNGPQGDQIRGFGFTHDGSFDTLFRFMGVVAFIQRETNPDGFPLGPVGEDLRRKAEAWSLVFDSNLAPIVGQQVTVNRNSGAAALDRVELMMARADVGECDLVAKSQIFGREHGWLYLGEGAYLPDRESWPEVGGLGVLKVVTRLGASVTFTCTPPGSGLRIGLDRDQDGTLDGDEA